MLYRLETESNIVSNLCKHADACSAAVAEVPNAKGEGGGVGGTDSNESSRRSSSLWPEIYAGESAAGTLHIGRSDDQDRGTPIHRGKDRPKRVLQAAEGPCLLPLAGLASSWRGEWWPRHAGLALPDPQKVKTGDQPAQFGRRMKRSN